MNLDEDPSPDLDSLAKCINDQETLARTFLSVQAIDPSNPKSNNIFKFNDERPTNQLPPVKVVKIESTGCCPKQVRLLDRGERALSFHTNTR
jgi:hypothetical protein